MAYLSNKILNKLRLPTGIIHKPELPLVHAVNCPVCPECPGIELECDICREIVTLISAVSTIQTDVTTLINTVWVPVCDPCDLLVDIITAINNIEILPCDLSGIETILTTISSDVAFTQTQVNSIYQVIVGSSNPVCHIEASSTMNDVSLMMNNLYSTKIGIQASANPAVDFEFVEESSNPLGEIGLSMILAWIYNVASIADSIPGASAILIVTYFTEGFVHNGRRGKVTTFNPNGTVTVTSPLQLTFENPIIDPCGDLFISGFVSDEGAGNIMDFSVPDTNGDYPCAIASITVKIVKQSVV